MGDFRATIRISWDCCGVHREYDGSINYMMDHYIDDRIDKFFHEAWAASIDERERYVRESLAEDKKARREADERAEYERLKAKYEQVGPQKET